MMRREVFKAAPLLALPAILPAETMAGMAEKETPCARIFRLWGAERARLNGPEGHAMPEADYDKAIAQFSRLDDAMRDCAAENARDFILKIIALSEYGTCGLPMRSTCPELWDEAEAFGRCDPSHDLGVEV